MTDMKAYLSPFIQANGLQSAGLLLPDITLDPHRVKVLMISEALPPNPEDGFYSRAPQPEAMKTTLALFQSAGIPVGGIDDILALGVYITTAVKSPKYGYAVDPQALTAHLPLLEAELDLFQGLQIIMLMGDVAKKAFNRIAKKRTGKNCIPSGSTYKIRDSEFYFGSIRVFPSYILTGGNLLIEKSKCEMIAEDLRNMMKLL